MEGKGVQIVLISVIIVLSLSLAGIIGYLVIFGVQKPVDGAAKETTTQEENVRPTIKDFGKAFQFRPFADDGENINLKLGEGRNLHVVKVGMVFWTTDKKVSDALETRKPQIRDEIISIFNNITYEEMKLPQAKNEVKDYILDRVNEMFDNKIADLSFEKWFLQ